MNSAKLHKIYLIAIAAGIVLAAVVFSQWRQHVIDDAQRDATISTQKAGIADLEKKIADAQSAAQVEIIALEKQKQQVSTSPAQAPAVIREVLPNVPAPAKPDLPNAPQPQMTLTPQDQTDLAQFILSCKQCSVERNQLQSQVADQQQVIDKQKTELGAAMKAAKGGTVWQRTKRVLKWGAIFGATGYVIGRAQK